MCLRCVLWKVLGFHGSHRGIEANLERLRAVLEMSLYRTRKEVQCLAGWIVMLSRFVAQSGNKCLPFFKVLKQIRNFCQTEECQAAFEIFLAAPYLTRPVEGEMLYLYLVISLVAVSSILVRKYGVQKLVYYTNKLLKDVETQYPKMEVAYALLISSRWLRPYFWAHFIAILTDQPLRSVL